MHTQQNNIHSTLNNKSLPELTVTIVGLGVPVFLKRRKLVGSVRRLVRSVRRLVGSVRRLVGSVRKLVGSVRKLVHGECEEVGGEFEVVGGSAIIPLTRSSKWFNMASKLCLSSPCLLDYRSGWGLINKQ